MRRAALAVIALAALPAPAALGAVTGTVMAGGAGPWDPVAGARLNPDGTLTLLRVAPGAARANATVTVTGNVAPSAAARAALRARWKAVLAAPRVATASRQVDAAFVTVTVADGPDTRTVIGLNTAPAAVRALVDRVNLTVPAARRLQAPAPPGQSQAATCVNREPGGAAARPATEVARDLTLAEAAQRGLVTLAGKGGFQGDQVAVTLTGKPATGPVRVRIRLEIEGPNAAGFPAAAVEKRLGTPTHKGTQVRFDIETRVRVPGEPPTCGWHQVSLSPDPALRPEAGMPDGSVPVPNSAQTGEADWYTGISPGQAAHEVLHLAGLPDRYRDVVVAGGKEYPVPMGQITSKAELDAWAKAHNVTGPTTLEPRPLPGHQNDIMATGELSDTSVVWPGDLAGFVARAGVRVTGSPGDVLLSKDPGKQNLVVGAPFDLFARVGETARADGLVVYCMDLPLGIPPRDLVFDVAGPARDLGLPQLQAVAEAVARAQPAPLAATPGGQSAIWQVTDADLSLSQSAGEIIRAAGLPIDLVLDTPQVANPNAGSPATGAVAGGAVLPPIPGPPAGGGDPAPGLLGALLSPGRVASSPRGRATLTLEVAAPATLRIVVQRRQGSRWRTLGAFPRRRVGAGFATLSLRLANLAPGRHRLRLQGVPGTPAVTFRVVRSAR
jgi:hypothetical protein